MTNATCTICDTALSGEKKELFVYEDACWRIRHSTETNILGYFILESKRHFLDLSEATEQECASYGSLLSHLMGAIRSMTGCERVYTFSLAEAVPHYHLHVIPRGENFPRAYKGRGIMTYPLSPSVSPVHLTSACDRIRRLLERSRQS